MPSLYRPLSFRPGILWLVLLVAAGVAVAAPDAEAAAGNQLSKRTQLRYEDVLTTRDGSRWRGKLLQKGDLYRIRLLDKSEVAVPKEQVMSITRELQTGYPHQGQWAVTVNAGLEVAIVSADSNAGAQVGPIVETTFTHNFGGAFEPEFTIVECPVGPTDGGVNLQLAAGVRYYLNPKSRAKPFTSTQVVFFGSHGDLGLRTGPGMIYDITPNFGLGFVQGVTLISQKVGGATPYKAAGVGYHAMLSLQGRF
ncbi:MAG: hypothetical protein EXR69_15645 [Myxococcales bacterium]|nr:hypothetical protein [Myxococcales bacterium]